MHVRMRHRLGFLLDMTVDDVAPPAARNRVGVVRPERLCADGVCSREEPFGLVKVLHLEQKASKVAQSFCHLRVVSPERHLANRDRPLVVRPGRFVFALLLVEHGKVRVEHGGIGVVLAERLLW